MKKFIVTATSASFAGLRVDTFSVRAWSVQDAEKKAREQGMCLARDGLEVREAKKNANGEYIE